MNKYLISADIEGITGVVDKSYADLNGKHYELGRRYMMHDVNAVINGILEIDPQAQIIVRDAHGAATNLDLEKLHPHAQLISGWGTRMNMLDSQYCDYTGIFLVGYHSGGQNLDAVLAHTYSSIIQNIKINNLAVNEAGLAALYAGYHGVSIAFLSGDNEAVKEAKNELKNCNSVTVSVKESYDRNSICSLSLRQAYLRLFEGAKKATQNLIYKKNKPLRLKAPYKVEIHLYNVGYKPSIFAKIASLLSFDSIYKFDREKFVISYTVTSQLEILQRLDLIVALIYGSKAFD